VIQPAYSNAKNKNVKQDLKKVYKLQPDESNDMPTWLFGICFIALMCSPYLVKIIFP
jgi:hypothetical protein